MPIFSIILPTTSDRGYLLPFSVQSVLNQSVSSFELLIIGDGVNQYTRNVIKLLQDKDARIKFFDFPKHIRRGEPYRHQVLTRYAEGTYIAYLLDRDLWLPNHLETLLLLFQKNGNFVASNVFKILQDKNIDFDLSHTVRTFLFSTVGHTLELYKNLPHGWRLTPAHLFTDTYMWEQFQENSNFRVSVCYTPSVLYFKRGATYPGIPTEKRVDELKNWCDKLLEPTLHSYLIEEALKYSLNERKKEYLKGLQILIKGRSISDFLVIIQTQFKYKLASLKRKVNYLMKGH